MSGLSQIIMWLSRLIDLIATSHEPLLMEGNLYGLSEVANSLLRPDGRTYWIEFNAHTRSKPGTDDFGFTSEYRVTSLSHAIELHSELVHPSIRPIVILTNVQYAMDAVSEMLSLRSNPRSSIVISGTNEAVIRLAELHPDTRFIAAKSLELSDAEALDLLGTDDPERSQANLSMLPNRHYDTVKKFSYQQLGLELPRRPTPSAYTDSLACLSKVQTSVTQLLVLNRQWKRALDVAIATGASAVPNFLDSAGEDAILRGELERFHRKLDALPSHVRADEKVLYWLLVAKVSLGLDSEILQEVRQAISTRSLPRLQVLLRLLGLDREKPITAYATGDEDLALELYAAHLQSYDGGRQDSVGKLRRLMDRFDESGNEYRLLQTMLYLTNSLIMSGNYLDAIYWGNATLERADSINADALEVVAATGLLAYVHLLTGSLEDAGELLSRIVQSDELVGKPYSEGVLSTMADHFAVNGHFATALEWYELSASRGKGPPVDIVAPDIALMLVRLKRSRESDARFRLKLETLDKSDDAFPWVKLAQAISNIGDNVDRAIGTLSEMLDGAENRLAGPFLARATLILALLLTKKNRHEEAFRRLDESEHVLRELAPTGWCLLTGGDADVSKLMEEWLNQKHIMKVRFLGDDYWEFREVGSASIGSMRIRELILILSYSTRGLTGEQLVEHMGWGPNATQTIRSHLRNLREHIPVTTGPYRLSVKVQADYLDVHKAIEVGDLDTAIENYNGPLLPGSDIPFVREYRSNLEMSLRAIVVQHGSPDQIAKLALKIAEDLELLELASRQLPSASALRMQLETQMAKVRRQWINDQ